MLKTSLPSAIVYGTGPQGPQVLYSDIYFEERLHERVNLYRLDPGEEGYTEQLVREHLANYKPDLIICIGESTYKSVLGVFKHNDMVILNRMLWYHEEPHHNILANDIVCQSTFRSCSLHEKVYNNPVQPFFSVFTGAYLTGERLVRAYESIRKQTYPNWEWIIVDDSPADDETTHQLALQLASGDDRVKVYRLNPTSGGRVGEVKYRAASLANGGWLVELDHDDQLISTLLEESVTAIHRYPDAGFIYTDVCELYETGEMRSYGMTAPNREWYGHPDNRFNWGYAGHEWVEADGSRYLSHLYPEINPKTIRFNIGMPNHARIWKTEVYQRVGGHNRHLSVADDYELIVKTFLATRFIHIRKMLYLQYNNRNSTVDNNSIDINRRARLVKDHYDQRIHQRIEQLGCQDSCWIPELNRAGRLQNDPTGIVFGEKEQILNYIIES